MDQLARLRAELDEINGELLQLLQRRAAVVLRVAALKHHLNLPLEDLRREHDMLADIVTHNRGPLPDLAVRDIFSRLVVHCKQLMRGSAPLSDQRSAARSHPWC